MTPDTEYIGADIKIDNQLDSPKNLISYRNARAMGRPKAPVQIDVGQKLYVTLDQERWWALAHLNGPTPSWHYIPMVLSFEQPLDKDRYKFAVRSLFKLFPILKSKFHLVNDSVELTYITEIEVDKIIDASLSCINDPTVLHQQDVQNNKTEGFPNSLFEFDYQKNNSSTFIIWKIHHIISDAKSSRLLRNAFYNYYNNSDNDFQIIPNAIDFQSYAKWQRDFYSKDNIILLKEFWAEWASHFNEISLPGSQTKLTSCSGRILRYRAFFGADILALLEDTARQLRVSLYDLLLGTLFNAMSIWANTEQVGALIVGDMRTFACLRNTVGLFACFDPIVITIKKDQGLINLLHNVRNARNNAFEMRLPPLRDAWPGSQYSWGSKLPMLVNDFSVESLRPDKNTILAAPAGSFNRDDKHAPLSVRIVRDRMQAALELEFNENVFSEKECNKFCLMIHQTITELTHSCGISISQL